MFMNKIVIIPSWYPLKEDKLPGLFFREQALLMQEQFDFRVLYGVPKIVNILFLPFFITKKTSVYLNLNTPPAGTGFYFYQIPISKLSRVFTFLIRQIEKINYFFMIKQFKKEYENLIKDNWIPDLIHAQSTVNGGIIAHALSEYLSIPFLITEHQVFLPGNFSNHKRKLISKALESANKVLVVSEHQKRQILMNNIDCYPIVVGNFVDDGVFYPKNSNVAKNKFKILFITYDSFIKDNDTFFKALAYLIQHDIIDFRAIIIGGSFSNPELTNEENPLYKLAVKYGLIKFVEILNFVAREDIPEQYNQSDVLVSTSIAETFGVAQCEAMMCGIPVIATANGGIDDFISNKNGIKIPIQDYKALADSIVKIKNREILFDTNEVRNSVLNKYGNKAFSGRLKNIYRKCINVNPNRKIS